MNMQKLIIIRGYPGSGKSTVSKKLVESAGLELVDHNHLLNLIRPFNGGTDEGIYEEVHSLELAIARSWLRKGKSVVVARGFASAASLSPYLAMAESEKVTPLVVTLEVPHNILAERVTSPERLENGFATTPEYLNAWIASHPMEPIEGEYRLNGEQSPEDLVAQIAANL